MDDPDVDHELIALLRESLGISNKAQDTVSSDTGKGYLSIFHVALWTSMPHITIARQSSHSNNINIDDKRC